MYEFVKTTEPNNMNVFEIWAKIEYSPGYGELNKYTIISGLSIKPDKKNEKIMDLIKNLYIKLHARDSENLLYNYDHCGHDNTTFYSIYQIEYCDNFEQVEKAIPIIIKNIKKELIKKLKMYRQNKIKEGITKISLNPFDYI